MMEYILFAIVGVVIGGIFMWIVDEAGEPHE